MIMGIRYTSQRLNAQCIRKLKILEDFAVVSRVQRVSVHLHLTQPAHEDCSKMTRNEDHMGFQRKGVKCLVMGMLKQIVIECLNIRFCKAPVVTLTAFQIAQNRRKMRTTWGAGKGKIFLKYFVIWTTHPPCAFLQLLLYLRSSKRCVIELHLAHP